MRSNVRNNVFASLKNSIESDPQPPVNRHDLTLHATMSQWVIGNPSNPSMVRNVSHGDQQAFAAVHALQPEPAQFIGFIRAAISPSGIASFNSLLGFAVANAPSRAGVVRQQQSVRHSLQTINPEAEGPDLDDAMRDPELFRRVVSSQHVALYSTLWTYMRQPEYARAETVSQRQHVRFQGYMQGNPEWVRELAACSSREAAVALAESKLQGVGTRSVEYVYWLGRVMHVIRAAKSLTNARDVETWFNRASAKYVELWAARGKAGVWSMLRGSQMREAASEEVILLRQIADRCDLQDPVASDGPFVDPGLLTPMRLMRLFSVRTTNTFSYFTCDWTNANTLPQLHALMLVEQERFANTQRLAALGQSAPPKPFSLAASSIYFLLGMRTHLYVKPFQMPESPLAKFFNMLSELLSLSDVSPVNMTELIVQFSRHMFSQLPGDPEALLTDMINRAAESEPQADVDGQPNPAARYGEDARNANTAAEEIVRAAREQAANDAASSAPDIPRAFQRTSTHVQPSAAPEVIEVLRRDASQFMLDSRRGHMSVGCDPEVLHNVARADLTSTVTLPDFLLMRSVIRSNPPPNPSVTLSKAFLLLAVMRSFSRLCPMLPSSTIPTDVQHAYSLISQTPLEDALNSVARGLGLGMGASFPFDSLNPPHVDTRWQDRALMVILVQSPTVHQFLGVMQAHMSADDDAWARLTDLRPEMTSQFNGFPMSAVLAVPVDSHSAAAALVMRNRSGGVQQIASPTMAPRADTVILVAAPETPSAAIETPIPPGDPNNGTPGVGQ